jgi:NADPH-dependent glutamate synthase beta subunit-like oxidoreductase
MTRISRSDGVADGTPMAVSLRSTAELTTGNWRTFRPRYVTRPSPCMLDCPAGTDVRAFLALAADGDAEGAWRTILERHPFPSVCGRVCYHPCEAACNRAPRDERVAVHLIERAIGDEAMRRRFLKGIEPPGRPDASRRVAVIGAGPAGLACAYHLARRGAGVTVFDAMPEPGGMLRYGIPAYRLPRAALAAEVELLRRLGVQFAPYARLGTNLGWDDLAEFAAVFAAIGAHRPRRLGIPGEDLAGVEPGLEFLQAVNMGTGSGAALEGPAVIVGGGNTDLDAARVALRRGATTTILYRRSRADMPAHPDEIAQAEAEGVELIFNAAPVRFHGRNGRLSGVEWQPMRPGPPDATGRPAPEPIPGRFGWVSAAHAFSAIGEDVEAERLAGFLSMAGRRLAADAWGRTPLPDVFAGGDAATGAGTVVHALGSGRAAAEAILARFEGTALPQGLRAERVGPSDVNLFYIPAAPRARPALLSPARATSSFEEVVGGLPWPYAVAEARRCIRCGDCTRCDNCLVFCPDAAIRRVDGRYEIDEQHCKGCGICVAECPRGAMLLEPEAQR